MPELPEIETIRCDLEKSLIGEQAISFEVFDRRLMTRQDEARWKVALQGQIWEIFKRKGKYLWIEFANGWRLMFHMRMTGQLIVKRSVEDSTPRLTIRFASGQRLSLYDQRRFAEAWLLPPGQVWYSSNRLGPDALTELEHDQFMEIVKNRTTRIQPLLMDQRLLSGVGNIYAQEALFKAGIRPNKSARRLSKPDVSRLFEALRETLETAIVYRGSSSRNYRDANGEAGSAQTLHAVYRKGGNPALPASLH